MRHVTLKDNVLLVGEERVKRQIDYYVVIPGERRVFVFRRKFSKGTYDLCRNGIRINDLTVLKTRDKGIMNLVKYVKVSLPYLVEYYGLPVVA